MTHPRESWASRISRRDFLRRSMGAAVAIPGAAALLAACAKSSTTGGGGGGAAFELARLDNPVELPLFDDNAAIADGLEPETGATVKVYGYVLYIKPKILRDFEAEHGCKVEYTTFDTMDEAVAKLRSGDVDFDLFVPAVSELGKLAAAKILRPINLSYIPNLDNVWPSLADPFYDKGPRYTVPYFVWTTGIAWRNDLVTTDIRAMDNPYEIFWDPQFKGHVHILNETRDAIALGLIKNGITDVNTSDPKQIDLAKNDLLALVDAVNPRFDHTDYRDMFAGLAHVHHSWSGNIGFAHYYAPKPSDIETLSYWWPAAGDSGHPGIVGSDTLGVLSSGKAPVLTHMLINELLDPEVAKDNSAYEGYQNPQSSFDPDQFVAEGIVAANLKDTITLREDFEKGLRQLELEPSAAQMWQRAYQEISGGV